MSWIKDLESMESSEEKDGVRINEIDYEDKVKEETEEIKSLDDVLKAIDGCFDSLEVLIELKNMDGEIPEVFDIVEERLNVLIDQGKEYGLTEKQGNNVIKKYERMIGPKTNKM